VRVCAQLIRLSCCLFYLVNSFIDSSDFSPYTASHTFGPGQKNPRPDIYFFGLLAERICFDWGQIRERRALRQVKGRVRRMLGSRFAKAARQWVSDRSNFLRAGVISFIAPAPSTSLERKPQSTPHHEHSRAYLMCAYVAGTD